jgi:hypothetical protein
LSQRYSALFPEKEPAPSITPAVNKKGLSEDLVSETYSKRPVLILGDIGVGKTMFFRNFIKIQAADIFEKAILLYIDFGTKAALSKDIREFAIDEITCQLRLNYGIDILEKSFLYSAYHGDILRFEKGLYGELKTTNPEAYNMKLIEYIEQKIRSMENHLQHSLLHIYKNHHKQIVMFLDNADQRSDEIQQQVFVMAQSIASNWTASVFLALRPETFQRSKAAGALSAYHLKAFTISPPRIDEVLDKRMQFGINISRGVYPMAELPKGVNIDLQQVASFFTIVQTSLRSKREVVECVDNLSWGNVRIALDFIKTFIGSGHIDTKKILEIYQKSGNYIIRLHEFLRSIIYGDAIYYDPASSPLVNLFDISTNDTKEHFLALTILLYLQNEGEKLNQHGFVAMESLYEVFQAYGFTPDQIDYALCQLWKKRLVETAGRVQPLEKSIPVTSLRLTSVGAYHLMKLPYMFVYYDAIVTDTSIMFPEYERQLLDVNDIRDRLKRCLVFLDYLDKCYDIYLTKCSVLDWNRMTQSTRKNISEIQEINS